MPTYSYACTECDNRFDIVQSFSDDSLTVCPACSGKLRKLFNSVGIVFKGSGFYRTDSRGGVRRGQRARQDRLCSRREVGKFVDGLDELVEHRDRRTGQGCCQLVLASPRVIHSFSSIHRRALSAVPTPAGLLASDHVVRRLSRPVAAGRTEHTEARARRWADRLVGSRPHARIGPAPHVARRVLAAALVCLALALLARGDPDSARSAVVVAARDLHPGIVLADADVGTGGIEAGTLPDGAVDRTGGRRRAHPRRTDPRRRRPSPTSGYSAPVSPRPQPASDDARIVPVRLADPAVTEILREGDRVDVLTVDPDTPANPDRRSGATVLASRADVVVW